MILAFVVGFVTDLFWAIYTTALADRRPGLAASMSMLLGAAAVLMVSFVATGVPAVLGYIAGLGAGTYAFARFAS